MTHDEDCLISEGKFDAKCTCSYGLLEELNDLVNDFDMKHDNSNPYYIALRNVVELAGNPLETNEIWPADYVVWYTYGYNLALIRILESIERDLA